MPRPSPNPVPPSQARPTAADPAAANDKAPQTPEQVMQAATARIAELEAELAGDEGPLDARRRPKSPTSAPAPIAR